MTDKRPIRTEYRIAYHSNPDANGGSRYLGRVSIYADPTKLYKSGILFMDVTNKEYAIYERDLPCVYHTHKVPVNAF